MPGILIIDDDNSIAENLSMYLSRRITKWKLQTEGEWA